MNLWWLASYVALWVFVLLLGFLLLGALRTRPARLAAGATGGDDTQPGGRNGLKPGKTAPDFALPVATGGEVTLSDFVGRKVLLVFTQSGCGPCHRIMPELNRLQSGRRGPGGGGQ